MDLRKFLATNLAKLSKTLITALNMGQGSSFPGRLALKIDPKLLSKFGEELQKTKTTSENFVNINVTGTNGKTTTCGLIRSVLEQSLNKELISNEMGANLDYGVCSALIEKTDLLGNLNSHNYVLEADEASLPNIAKALDPKIITVTNLFRDQLDRFGELETTKKLINTGISKASNPLLVLNADDPLVASLGSDGHNKIFYSVKDSEGSKQETQSHQRGSNNLEAIIEIKSSSSETSEVRANLGSETFELTLPLPGKYNAYNLAAALASIYALGRSGFKISTEDIVTGIENYKTNFGRAEKKTINGIQAQTFLIKNPKGASEVLRLIKKDSKTPLLIIINDNYADGRDVSWLWDAEFEELSGHKGPVMLSGSRAEDMAIRLKYAGLKDEQLETCPSIAMSLEKSTQKSKENGGKLFILPTYTALLELEKIS